MGSRFRAALLVGTIAILTGGLVFRGRSVAARPDANEMPAERFVALATTVAMPTYPRGSLQRRAGGVAVARATVSRSGDVGGVEILEAPDNEIGGSLRTALLHWRFPAQGPDNHLDRRGRVVVYFVVDGARGLVLTPQGMAERRRARTTSPAVPGNPASEPNR